MGRLRAAWSAWRSFAGAGPVTRAFVLARLLIAPLTPLERELAAGGRVLSVGCGYGVVERYLAERNPALRVDGVELDAERVAVAAATGARAPRVSVREEDVTRLAPGAAYDAALAVDVLHHVPAEQHEEVLAALGRSLRPGGVLVVKDIATTPRWGYEFNRMHDRLVAGPDPIFCRSPEQMAALGESAGLVVESARRIGRLSPYPHYLLRLRRPA